jgi:PAS domain-containing protein
MSNHAWVKELPAIITVSDADGIIIAMNDKAIEYFEEDGGERLIGTNVLDCHPEPSRSKFEAMIKAEQDNIYTFEEDGVKMMAYQTPWYKGGKYAGFFEILIEVPEEITHHSK